ncbi:PEP-CTERM system histidine kinase PrsK [Permianibacter sp. IMCC34836]|uniref:XrtA/PEP-CTERM system histidine kinase PrsK n=1 Tax=Permianibacter fluminis TaxID=2738515 RepID=UPI0015556111|nr:XrtA/PEP-CTERM system histidine kinase PrsK [Permianibacter fluminis]NQD35615.1 PEP-CTERM system histidine kinase PrsK [Permianibacter fluminis]
MMSFSISWFALLGYGIAAVAFAVLALLLASRWRGRLTGNWLLLVLVLQLAWALSASVFHWLETTETAWVYGWLESLRYIGWLLLLRELWQPLVQAEGASVRWYRQLKLLLIGLAIVLTIAAIWPALDVLISRTLGLPLLQTGMLILALSSGVLTEQLYRRTRPEQRWAIKFLCLGFACVFAYDFYLYSDALLFRRIDADIEAARGFVYAVGVPLLAVAVARNPRWSIDLFISRGLMLRSLSVLGAGGYLLLMALVGFYIRSTNAEFGDALRIVFLALALVALLVVAISGQVRSRIKVFINKHFFNYQYDYREEWLRLNRTLAGEDGGGRIHERAIRALADIVDSPAGMLWLCQDEQHCEFAEHWCMPPGKDFDAKPDRALLEFLRRTGWVIELAEYRQFPDRYAELDLPNWWFNQPNPWLILPLRHGEHLTGIMLLAAPRANRPINWEVRDLLKTAAAQVASYLALYQTTLALVEARQFEAFNRLSAFVVHDLKNVAAQLQLIVSNADRHRNNPAFIDDAIQTVGNATGKMQRMLAALRKGSVEAATTTAVAIDEVIAEAVRQCSKQTPEPQAGPASGARVRADRERLLAVLQHLIQNAQEACEGEGQVNLTVVSEVNDVTVKIRDNGCGMDADFIRERLFRPFDTTKGNAGMGIGAYQARETVRSFGGDVTVTSSPGQGSEFSLRLVRIGNDSESVGAEQTQ